MELDAQWIVGFTDGEGCFHVGVAKHPEMKMGVQVLPELTIVQHKRDVHVLHAIKRFFCCGAVRTNHGDRMCFRVRKLRNILDHVIPFFDQHPLKTRKRQDFLAFRDVVLAMSRGEHLTDAGLQRITRIAKGMNTGREDGGGEGKVKSSPS